MKEADRLVVLGDESQGIALIKAEIFEKQKNKELVIIVKFMEN